MSKIPSQLQYFNEDQLIHFPFNICRSVFLLAFPGHYPACLFPLSPSAVISNYPFDISSAVLAISRGFYNHCMWCMWKYQPCKICAIKLKHETKGIRWLIQYIYVAVWSWFIIFFTLNIYRFLLTPVLEYASSSIAMIISSYLLSIYLSLSNYSMYLYIHLCIYSSISTSIYVYGGT